jgi:hypothetical protein
VNSAKTERKWFAGFLLLLAMVICGLTVAVVELSKEVGSNGNMLTKTGGTAPLGTAAVVNVSSNMTWDKMSLAHLGQITSISGSYGTDGATAVYRVASFVKNKDKSRVLAKLVDGDGVLVFACSDATGKTCSLPMHLKSAEIENWLTVSPSVSRRRLDITGFSGFDITGFSTNSIVAHDNDLNANPLNPPLIHSFISF